MKILFSLGMVIKLRVGTICFIGEVWFKYSSSRFITAADIGTEKLSRAQVFCVLSYRCG